MTDCTSGTSAWSPENTAWYSTNNCCTGERIELDKVPGRAHKVQEELQTAARVVQPWSMWHDLRELCISLIGGSNILDGQTDGAAVGVAAQCAM